jgi:hypothetical protein
MDADEHRSNQKSLFICVYLRSSAVKTLFSSCLIERYCPHPPGFQPVISLADRRDALSALTGWQPVLQTTSSGWIGTCRDLQSADAAGGSQGHRANSVCQRIFPVAGIDHQQFS